MRTETADSPEAKKPDVILSGDETISPRKTKKRLWDRHDCVYSAFLSLAQTISTAAPFIYSSNEVTAVFQQVVLKSLIKEHSFLTRVKNTLLMQNGF